MRVFSYNISKAPKDTLANLLFFNLLPIIGVMFLNWDLFILLFIYWLETAVIGIVNIFKMALAHPIHSDEFKNMSYEIYVVHAIKLFLIPFFCVHFGGFMAGHFVFISTFYGKNTIDLFSQGIEPIFKLFNWEIILALTGIFLGHAYSFVKDYVFNKSYLLANPAQLMFGPYPRIFAMHLFIILSSFIWFATNNLLFCSVLMAVLKFGTDLAMTLNDQEKQIFPKS